MRVKIIKLTNHFDIYIIHVFGMLNLFNSIYIDLQINWKLKKKRFNLKTCIFSFNIRPLNVGFAVQINGLIWKGDKHFFLGNISYLIFLKNYELVKSICINLHLILATLPDHWDILKSVKRSRLPLMNFYERKMVKCCPLKIEDCHLYLIY